MNKFLKWQNQDNSNKNRILVLVIGALIFPMFGLSNTGSTECSLRSRGKSIHLATSPL